MEKRENIRLVREKEEEEENRRNRRNRRIQGEGRLVRETSNNETSNNETSNNETSNNETSNSETSNNETSNSETSNSETSNSETSNSETRTLVIAKTDFYDEERNHLDFEKDEFLIVTNWNYGNGWVEGHRKDNEEEKGIFLKELIKIYEGNF